MIHISEYLNESLVSESLISESEKSIKSEKDFREYAETKFKKVFGDDLDEDKMKETIDGILKKYKDDAEKGAWGKLVGILNKSF